MYFKKIFPESFIRVFEPNPLTVKVLKENVKNNKISNIFIYKKAVTGKKIKTKKLFFPKGRSAVASLHPNFVNLFSNTLNTKVVESISLGEVIQKVGHVDILKVDSEGEEIALIPEILKLSDKIDMFMIEMHEFRDKPIYTLIQTLKQKYNTVTRNLYDMEAVNNRLFQLNKNEPMLCFMLYGVAKRFLKQK
jgi:FkbM family methyltransferase